mmetsp:Transcript_2744/g.3777  ORF Transcript_2744/g.3777 Transcript_2744/m.3777 type:complete len:94 (+) Transcript_2744:1589-1870(+)
MLSDSLISHDRRDTTVHINFRGSPLRRRQRKILIDWPQSRLEGSAHSTLRFQLFDSFGYSGSIVVLFGELEGKLALHQLRLAFVAVYDLHDVL